MSNCFRCGKPLPEGQVECDPPCDESRTDTLPPELAAELATAEFAATALVNHVARMGAGGFRAKIAVGNAEYFIHVRRSDFHFPPHSSLPTPHSKL